jgi:hypothetical protein
MNQVLEDPEFGRLELDVFWNGWLSTGLGPKVRLEIDADNDTDPPSKRQREALGRLIRKETSTLARAQAALARYYREIVPHYRASGYLSPESTPELAADADIWRLLSCPAIFVPVQVDRKQRLRLQWECTWDVEHGVEVELKNNAVASVGIIGH